MIDIQGMKLFEQLPQVETKDAIVSPVGECGANLYMRRFRGMSVDEYQAYKTRLEQCGFEKYSELGSNTRHKVVNTAYWKDGIGVHITHNGYVNLGYVLVHESDRPMGRQFDEEFSPCGDDHYVKVLKEVSFSVYQSFLLELTKDGFSKISDNGENGLGNNVYQALYQKENETRVLVYLKSRKQLHIIKSEKEPISSHLFPQTKVDKQVCPNSLHMLELWWYGNSFVVQLKNGHFLISDGGMEDDLRYLVDYLKLLVPNGDKPIVDGWFISHAHRDHVGAICAVLDLPKCADEMYVEGIYYNEPSDAVIDLEPQNRAYILFLKQASKMWKNTNGDAPDIYRTYTGQRYYFCDVTVDIMLAQEQNPVENYMGDFNDSSTWCLWTIDNQKCLLGGDGDKGSEEFIVEIYDEEMRKFDFMSLLHHGHNTRDFFTDACTVRTCLVTNRGKMPAGREKENNHLKSSLKEWITWESGTCVFEFPYQVGEWKRREALKWMYHEGIERPNK